MISERFPHANQQCVNFPKTKSIAYSAVLRVDRPRRIRTLVSSLTAYLRSYISGNLISLEHVPYAEFLEVLPSPTCLVSRTLK